MILCCGEALIDMIPDKTGAFNPVSGGAVFNTAIGLGRQGVDVGFLSGVSTDMFGQKLVGALEESSVKSDFLIRSDRPTTLAFVELVDGKASYAFYDENTAGRMIEPNDLPNQLPKKIKALFFGGISLAVEPCADTYLDLLGRSAGDRLIMVDPNIRANFISNEARYRERLNEFLRHSDIIKVSDEDLDWIDPSDEKMETKAAKIIEMGPTIVFVTLGERGAKAFTQDGLVAKVGSTSVKVIDTVGAGDTFNAGLLTCLSRGNALSKTGLTHITTRNLTSAIEFAVDFASDTATRRGADPAWNFIS